MGLRIEGLRSTDYPSTISRSYGAGTDYAERGQLMVNRYLLFVKRYDGGGLYHMVDIPILAKIDDMQKVEDVHMIVVHMAMQRILRGLK